MNILFYIAGFIFVVSAGTFLTSFFVTISARRGKTCTQKGTATLIRVTESAIRDVDRCYEIEYTCDGIAHRFVVGEKYVEGVSTETPAGTQVPIWYDPDDPKRVIIAEDPFMRKTVESWKRTRKHTLILMLISVGIMVFASARAEKSPGLPFTTTTIGQFSEEISALADKTPTALVYTESIGSPGTFSVMVDDPAIAKEVLNIILSADVNKRGCQVDMTQFQYEEYCFVFGEETFTFSFIPHSYFCYNGEDYELGENRLVTVCDYLHEMAAEAEITMEPQSKWYGDDAELQTNFVDNGDEARSLTELTLSAGGETITGVIEGAYDVLSVDKQPDGYVLRYTYGDFYSHEATRSSRITVENGEMVITDIAQ